MTAPDARPVRWWACGEGHTFSYGEEPWHWGATQGAVAEPFYCQAVLLNGNPCMDSSHLFGPHDTRAEAQASYDSWKAGKAGVNQPAKRRCRWHAEPCTAIHGLCLVDCPELVPLQAPTLRDQLAEWLANEYGEKPVRDMEPWRRDADRLLPLIKANQERDTITDTRGSTA